MISVVRRSTLRELREASPLTGLPGNTRIYREISQRLADKAAFAVCHVDIDRFKSVNDAYGFLRGDDMILLLARVLHEACAEAFVGHVGGDDFVVICSPEQVMPLFTTVITDFERHVPRLYDPADAERGFLLSIDRHGREQQWELVTLSIGVASTEHRQFRDPAEIAAVASEMKCVAKRHPGSHICLDRRRK